MSWRRHPDREIEVWEHLGKCYRFVTAGEEFTQGQKQEILQVMVLASVNGAVYTARHFEPVTLPADRVKEIAAFVEGTWPDAEWPAVPPGRGPDANPVSVRDR